ncbi:hypothetical protein BX592_12260 [Paraburkholderia rhizosphaerae]|uniref:Uncharacterized protein n=1 Tax=Paraburkholderia rhizosphaerae TaxID=480658 RepID=A0A4R8LGI7_9BURK|nr:hypothetical protein BX592_12260 [Paraburkholderia rhizosphaerae]
MIGSIDRAGIQLNVRVETSEVVCNRVLRDMKVFTSIYYLIYALKKCANQFVEQYS